jgi:hypothetical protein
MKDGVQKRSWDTMLQNKQEKMLAVGTLINRWLNNLR